MKKLLDLIGEYRTLQEKINKSRNLYPREHDFRKSHTLYDTHEEVDITAQDLLPAIGNLLSDKNDIDVVLAILQKEIGCQSANFEQAKGQFSAWEADVEPDVAKAETLKDEIMSLMVENIGENTTVYKSSFPHLTVSEITAIVEALKSINCKIIDVDNALKKVVFSYGFFASAALDERVQIDAALFETISDKVRLRRNRVYDIRDYYDLEMGEQFGTIKGGTMKEPLDLDFIFKYSEELARCFSI
jgi:hypothetical protein